MAVHHASAGEIVDLRPLGAGLKNARTSAIVKTNEFEAVRLIVHAGDDIAPPSGARRDHAALPGGARAPSAHRVNAGIVGRRMGLPEGRDQTCRKRR